jgi:hypothetical protein
MHLVSSCILLLFPTYGIWTWGYRNNTRSFESSLLPTEKLMDLKRWPHHLKNFQEHLSGIAASFSYLQHELASVEASYGYQAVYLRYTANKSHIFDSQTGVVEDRHKFSSDGFHSVVLWVIMYFSIFLMQLLLWLGSQNNGFTSRFITSMVTTCLQIIFFGESVHLVHENSYIPTHRILICW